MADERNKHGIIDDNVKNVEINVESDDFPVDHGTVLLGEWYDLSIKKHVMNGMAEVPGFVRTHEGNQCRPFPYGLLYL